MLTLTFTLTRPEFFAVWRRLQLQRRSCWSTFLVAAAIIGFGVVISSAVEVLIGVALAAWWMFVLTVLSPRRLWRRNPRLRAEQELRFSENEVTQRLLHSETKYDWDHWTEIKRVGDAYVMRSAAGGITLIPLRAFGIPADEKRFRELAAAHTLLSA
jgi:YcxB-like protein